MASKSSSEKSPLESKKFWAFLLTLASLTSLISVGMWMWRPLDQWSTTVLVFLIVVLGVVACGLILGQAGLDALTHLVEIVTPDFFRKNRGLPPSDLG